MLRQTFQTIVLSLGLLGGISASHACLTTTVDLNNPDHFFECIKAADPKNKHNAEAQYMAGKFFQRYLDLPSAAMMYKKAIKQNYTPAQADLTNLQQEVDAVNTVWHSLMTNLTPTEQAETNKIYGFLVRTADFSAINVIVIYINNPTPAEVQRVRQELAANLQTADELVKPMAYRELLKLRQLVK